MLRAAVLSAVVLASLSACGSKADSEGASGGATEPSAAASTSLRVVVTAGPGTAPMVYELTCDPTGGDHRQAEQACAAIDAAGADVFDPVPSDQACTMIYGGPQQATVKGVYEGEDVDASFSRDNGCQIDRWEQLGTTFFDIALQ